MNAAVFIVCCLAGFWAVNAAMQDAPALAAAKPADAAGDGSHPALPPEERTPDSSPAPPALPPLDADSPLTAEIAWLRRLETMPLSEFPALIQQECRTAPDATRVQKAIAVWMDRDFPGHAVWLKTQPSTARMEEQSAGGQNYVAPLHQPAIKRLAARDPEAAWKLARELQGEGDGERWSVVAAILDTDPQAAAQFTAKHLDELAGCQNTGVVFYNKDPVKSLPILQALPPGSARNSIAKNFTRHYTENLNEVADAKEWFQELPEDARRSVADFIRVKALHSGASDQVKRLSKLWVAEPP